MPTLAVAHELKRQSPDTTIIFVSEKGGKFGHLVRNHTSIDSIKTIYAGKFRRYHDDTWLKRLIDLPTILLNARDFFLVIIGFFQSVRLIMKEKPDAIFLKGSYEGLPMGLAAALLRKPYITHDSDSTASLTNRVIGRWAKYNTIGVEVGSYPYPKARIRYVGIPIGAEYRYVDKATQAEYREDINIPKTGQMVLVTGGSLGATKINTAVDKILKNLIGSLPDLYVVLQVGKGKAKDLRDLSDSQRVRVEEFIPTLYKYTGAADVVVTRGGADSLAELALQAKPCIIIPSPSLAGGHQLKNAEILLTKNAIELIPEKNLVRNPELLLVAITKLLKSGEKRQELSDKIRLFGRADAANEIASLLISVAN
jgi:UDP-N-acetylglucosamine--N-acetylmuramyl-(pentapeptide) pyrophosphoryl-undecaprenol N-acetylglucosamine transferase